MASQSLNPKWEQVLGAVSQARLWLLTPSRRGWVGIILLTASITVAHFAIPTHFVFWHVLLRRAYYLPIVWAVYLTGLRGGVVLSSIVVAVSLLHLLTGWRGNLRSQLDPVYDMAGFLAVGIGVGYLVDRSRKAAVNSAHREWDGELRSLVSAAVHDLKSPIASSRELSDSLLQGYELGTWERSVGVRIRKNVRRLTDVRMDLVGVSRILFDRALLTETGAWMQHFVSDSHSGGLHGSIQIKIDTVSPPPSHWPVSPATLNELMRCLIDGIHSDEVDPKEGEITLSGSTKSFVLRYRTRPRWPGGSSLPSRMYSSSQLRERLVEILLRRVNGTLDDLNQNGERGFRVELERSKLRIGAKGSGSRLFSVGSGRDATSASLRARV